MFSEARKNMVDGQIHTAGVTNPDLLKAFEDMPRELFVPEKLKHVAYTDVDLDLGQGRYLVEPIVYSKMLEYANLSKNDVVLDVASGCGYSSAILSRLANTVISLESNKRQRDKAERVMQSLDICNVVHVDGDIARGVADHAPYSLIVINGSVPEVSDDLLDQISCGGRLVCVLQSSSVSGGRATLFTKSSNGNISSRTLFDASVPSLKEFSVEQGFAF